MTSISDYLDEVYRDLKGSRDSFPKSTFPSSQWPIPFFGNPKGARVATVGVNPSSGEFHASRNWRDVGSVKDWKERLRDYFNHPTAPAHRWFEPWRTGLELLGVSHEKGTATHLDLSYRATRAMRKNSRIDPEEFRRMVERDVVWFFKLLSLYPSVRLLLTFGPIVRADGSIESLSLFLKSRAAKNGFTVLPEGNTFSLQHTETKRVFFVHEADMCCREDIANRVVKNLQAHRVELLKLLR